MKNGLCGVFATHCLFIEPKLFFGFFKKTGSSKKKFNSLESAVYYKRSLLYLLVFLIIPIQRFKKELILLLFRKTILGIKSLFS